MKAVNPYLNFPGTAEEAFNFYKSVFGGEFQMIQRFKETPEASKFAESEQNKIMHISLPLGTGNILMASDISESMKDTVKLGNNFYIALSADSKEESEKIFNGLSSGGTIELPLQDTFWGAYFGMLKDKYGVKWMVSYDSNQNM